MRHKVEYLKKGARSGEDEKRRGGSDGVLVDEEGMSFGRWQEANEMKTRQRGDEEQRGPHRRRRGGDEETPRLPLLFRPLQLFLLQLAC
ncbi:hypothetical protein QVD17_03639 [Tagetes erecta]|uniref:Uncharacterized protein n=1 Tax=Tagetes erecta TaxID=13708 RepID=A0AAD8P9V8_TARER|nr:hypothetical protein QVD17_03639 [Tagetes erecta]